MSQLSQQTGLPVATLKFYLREGLLHPGRTLSRTTADYDETHVDRVRLVRALVDAGGLDLAAVGKVLEAIDATDAPRLGVLEAAANAVTHPAEPSTDTARARAWIADRGWRIADGDPLVAHLAGAWQACDAAGLGLTEEHLGRYADAVEQVAQIDVASVPADPAGAVRQVVLGTVLVDPVLAILRRLAQQHVAVSHETAREP